MSKKVGWTLLQEQRLANGGVPDGTLRDAFLLPRGYWEAKDTADDLNVEIKKKIDAGYPLTNIIFEDTRRAVLYQDGQRKLEVDMTQAQQVADLLHEFTTHAEPDIEQFERAVAEFKARIPELAQGVLLIIAKERKENKRFVKAFSEFHELCKTALDPRISEAQIDEMLVQHLLTERLFRTVFDNQDFTQRNAIASEIEKVIYALTSRAFNRGEFLKSLDRFYLAIEDTARGLGDFSEKQHFLNVVYERFFQGFSVKQADTMGIVYTPQEIVDFMCASVEEVLQREFGKSLSTPGVKILDPCVGTGNFIVNILRRIDRSKVKQKYAEDLFCNEIMLLPYYIASLNIEHEYFQLTGEYAPFEGICFADTLDLAEAKQFGLFNEENTARVAREKGAEITVIIGNPPYNMGQRNENDNNKNRSYPVIDQRVRETYVQDSTATNRNKLGDPYVKFFRWATDRLQGRDGVVCYVSNNSFVDLIAFDGMRKHLLQDFTCIYHVDLHGNVRKNPKLSGTTHNVFGIQLGVGITIAIRNSANSKHAVYYERVPESWTRHEKYRFLRDSGSFSVLSCKRLNPDAQNTWLTEGLQEDFASFIPIAAKSSLRSKVDREKAVFLDFSLGVVTNRDNWVYDWSEAPLAEKVRRLSETYNSEVDRWKREGCPREIDSFVLSDETKVKWSRDLKADLKRRRYVLFSNERIRHALYRPFAAKAYYFDPILSQDVFLWDRYLPTRLCEEENRIICAGAMAVTKPFYCLITNRLTDLHYVGDSQCFPFYTYKEDGTNRRENITDWALAQFREKCGEEVSKWNIFHYVYALLHHPVYCERYAENLKRELPRIPMTVAAEDFPTYAEIGRKLADLHLNYETVKEYPLKWIENKDIPFSWRVEKMRLSKDRNTLAVNDSLTLAGFPLECFDYCLGNRSAVEWVIDQYRTSTDKRSGITSDPNRADDPEYIIRLVGRVVTVSLETVKLVRALPGLGIPTD
ncbi:MAG: type ISP restriction/modification enzyme [Armatimonadota bacterium]|nr:type ISP restriction/modification enzyme [Armatimonadota bacterium]